MLLEYRASAYGLAAILLVTSLLYLPVLGTGLFGDDYWWILGFSAPHGTAGAYDMSFGTAAAADFWRGHGVGPWWVGPDFRWSLFRPLSTWLLAWEWAAFGTSDLPWQIPSLVAYLGMVALLGTLYRRLVDGPTALVATFVFATHFSHLQTVWFVANGHTLVGGVPALAALLAWRAFREEHWRPGLPLAFLGLSLGLAGSETALAALVYAIVAEWLSVRADRYRTIFGLAAVGVAYVALHGALGHGVAGSSEYADPRSGLLAWLTQMVGNAPALISSSLDLLPADAWLFVPKLRPAILAAGCLGPVVLGALLRAAWPRLTAQGRHAVKLAALGAVGCLPLVAGAPVGGRLVLWVTVGSSLLLATVMVEAWRARAHLPWRVVFGASGLVLGVLLPVGGAARLLGVADLARAFRRAAAEAEVDTTADKDVVVVTSGDALSAIYLLPTRLVLSGAPAPRASAVMSAAVADHRVSRTAADTLEVEVLGSSMWRHSFERLFLSRDHAPAIGEPWSAGVFTATVLAEDAYGPTRVSFRFPSPVDDPRYVFLAWQEGRLARFDPPALGQVAVLHWSFAPMHSTP